MNRRTALRRFTPLRSSALLKAGGQIRHRSVKRSKQEREYVRLRDAYMAGHPLCELCGEAPSRELHHRRGRVGSDLTNADHFAALCSPCHRFATERPAEAIRLGISEPRIGRTAE